MNRNTTFRMEAFPCTRAPQWCVMVHSRTPKGRNVEHFLERVYFHADRRVAEALAREYMTRDRSWG